MSDKQQIEIINALEKVLTLSSSLASPIENWENANRINELSIQLREVIQSKMPNTHKNQMDIF